MRNWSNLVCCVYKRGLWWLNVKELGLNWNGFERDVGVSLMLNEECSFLLLEEVMKLLIVVEGKIFWEFDEIGCGDLVGNKGLFGNIIEEFVLYYFVNLDVEVDIFVGDMCYEFKVILLKYFGKGKCMKIVVKERFVFDIINYENLFKENFEDFWFWNKLKNIIMVYYYDDCEDKKI